MNHPMPEKQVFENKHLQLSCKQENILASSLIQFNFCHYRIMIRHGFKTEFSNCMTGYVTINFFFKNVGQLCVLISYKNIINDLLVCSKEFCSQIIFLSIPTKRFTYMFDLRGIKDHQHVSVFFIQLII